MKNITINQHILNGTPVFSGTRIPIRILFEYLEAGDNLDDFLEEFPSISKEVATSILYNALEAILKNAHTS
jgi:uncharacterized protein (DUF433 family)